MMVTRNGTLVGGNLREVKEMLFELVSSQHRNLQLLWNDHHSYIDFIIVLNELAK